MLTSPMMDGWMASSLPNSQKMPTISSKLRHWSQQKFCHQKFSQFTLNDWQLLSMCIEFWLFAFFF